MASHVREQAKQRFKEPQCRKHDLSLQDNEYCVLPHTGANQKVV